MKTTGRDQRIADEAPSQQRGYTPELMCAALGCPSRWTVDAGNGKLCSAHAWADPHEWSAITDKQLRDDLDRSMTTPKEQERVADPARMRAMLRDLANRMRTTQQDPKAWAHRLRDREYAGQKLSERQREAWRTALSAERVTNEDAES